MSDLLPESRLKHAKGVIRIEFGEWGRINMVPIFCASCGKLGAYVPEENMTFAFWLCDGECSNKWANLAGTYTTSDEVFWQKVAEESIEQRGHYLTEQDVLKEEASTWGSLSKLLRESPLTRR